MPLPKARPKATPVRVISPCGTILARLSCSKKPGEKGPAGWKTRLSKEAVNSSSEIDHSEKMTASGTRSLIQISVFRLIVGFTFGSVPEKKTGAMAARYVA